MQGKLSCFSSVNPSGQKMDMATVKKLAISTATAASILFAGASAVSAQDDARIKQVVKEVSESKKVAQATQSQIEKLDNKTQSLISQYKQTLKAIAGLEAFNAQQRRTIDLQKKEITKLQTSISGVASIKNQIPGLMEEMIGNLEEFIAQDIPFEMEARQNRLQELKDVLVDPGFEDPERFRVILEAYKTEAGYGSSINAWSGELDGRTVNFARVGRIGYYYQTKDGKEAGAYVDGSWQKLDAQANSQIRNLMKMARKQAPFDVLALPIIAPQEK
ncbi:DUF3450 domain-containing protein [Temperatibacter marinus]|uniref:DUF3450 domain-containing protein n=1 Tax=Temperatibacter marinus TaxID=1456591 RepID=A0AA52EDP1_9PROT|nr:DUF3450 domain-containing protein [Temperatibacter marinus]WND02881.1 DUF3450 domain-containing protein [Temperatibacter marinus]